MYFECQRLMNEDGGYITWSYGQNVSANSKKLAHQDTVAGNWHLDGCKITERWWMA
jgi:peptide/nickel transport system substrate-binding protein